MPTSKARFPLGQTVATPGALAAFEAAGQDPGQFFARHQSGDWGEVPPADAAKMELSVEQGFGILLSAYTLETGVKVWIITEADRSVTTLLLPSEY